MTSQNALAAPQSQETGLSTSNDGNQYLTFIMDKEEYGVDILNVQEIRGWEPSTLLPNAPEFVKGVINLRGTVVPIIDLRQRFGLTSVDYGPMTVVIVLKVELDDKEKIMGIVVDAVSDVYTVTDEQKKPAPDFGSAINTDFIEGLVSVEEKMIILLDISKMLDLEIQASIHAAEQLERMG